MKQSSSDQLHKEIKDLRQKHPGINELEVIAVDISGHFFGKRYPIARLESFATDGLAFPRSMFLLSTLGESLPDMHYGNDDGDPDAHFFLIPGSLCVNDWGSQPRAQVMATSHSDNEPTFFEPRNVLKKVLQAYTDRKWQPMVAFELEFYLFDRERDGADLIKIIRNPKTGRLDTPTVLSSTRISDFEQVIDDIIKTCKQQDIETGAISAEMGPGQFEINFNHHADVLRAADETCLFKRSVIEVAKKHGMMASFMAKPLLQQPGNGLHMHISVIDNKGKNIFADGNKPHQRLLDAIGGLLDTMPAAMSFWAPNINSYRRYAGGSNLAPVSLTWGNENRTVAFRIPLAKDGAWRVENRVPGADANPYLAMAVTLAGMWYGMEHKLDPGKAVDDSVEGKDKNLPLNLPSALNTTVGSQALIETLGRNFIELYCQHRESETFLFEQSISPREYDWYL
jgi:glutamine synthetase